ncbi:MAG: choice-of-anchor Q domain-containing protein [Ilumatobacteraceae bacterium]
MAAVAVSLFAMMAGGVVHGSQASASTVIHANSASGDDATGDGTAGNPYRTFHKAYTEASAGEIIDLDGTFTWTDADETGDVATTGYRIGKSLTIRGQSRSTIVQAASTRNTADRMVFFVNRGVTVTFQSMTVRHGRVVTDDHGAGITVYGEYCGTGGGCAGTTGVVTIDQVNVVDNDADTALNSYTYDRAGGIMLQENARLTVLNSNVENNNCRCKYYAAGGIYGGMQSANITILNSSISHNTVVSDGGSTYPFSYTSVAGGLASQRFGTLTVTNSTFHGNVTNSYGGAMSLYYQDRGVRLTNVTITGNSATLGAGGILWNQLYTGNNYDLRMKNVLLANNTGSGGASDDFYATSATSASAVVASYSIVESSSHSIFSGTGMITGNQASLNLDSSLSDNGAITGTRSLGLLAGSVAIDAGDAAAHGRTGYTVTPPAEDQRGAPRVGAVDIGAFEFGGTTPTTTTTSTTTTTTSTTTTTTTTLPASTSVPQSSTTTSAAPTTAPSGESSGGSTTATTVATVATGTVANVDTPQTSSGQVSTPTTVAQAATTPSVVRPAVSVATTSSTSTTVAVAAAGSDLIIPDAPDAALGDAVVMVNGEGVAMSISRENNTMTVSGAGITLTIAAILENGEVVPLDTEGNVRLDGTRYLRMDGFGVGLDSPAEVWVFSEPTFLGSLEPDREGKISGLLAVPADVEPGNHRLVIKAQNQSGDDATMAVGIGVGEAPAGVAFEWLIGIPLALAVVAGLVIPARRRRRQALE